MAKPNIVKSETENTPNEILGQAYKRAIGIYFKRAKNLVYVKGLRDAREEFYIELESTNQFLDRMDKSFFACSSQGLGAVELETGKHHFSLKTANFCNHRLCCVCNAQRSKLLRKRYYKFFDETKRNLFVKFKHVHFFPRIKEKDKDCFVSGADLLESLDFMHLTLSIPHTNGQWRGNRYYAKEMKTAFNHMRKNDWWAKNIFGGEYSIETTKNENGLHIHIHCMVMVKKFFGSRNFLYLKIQKCWNEYTIDNWLPPAEFSEERILGMLDSFPKNMLEIERRAIIKTLDSRGSTLTGLKSLYTEITSKDEYDRRTFGKFTQDGKMYAYCNVKNKISLTRGIMECLKYHFEPAAIEDSEGKIDLGLLCELLPNVYKQRLYGKFGGLYGIKSLNVQEEKLDAVNTNEQLSEAEEKLENAKEEMHHPFTGYPVKTGSLVFVSVDIKKVIFNKNKKHSRINYNDIHYAIEASPGQNTLSNAIKRFTWITTHREGASFMKTIEEFDTIHN